MKKIEFDGIIGSVDEKTNCIILRVGTETHKKRDDGKYESITEWINCIVGLDARDKYRVGDRYFFRGDFTTEAYVSKQEARNLKVQISVFVSEKPVCLYRKKDVASDAAPSEPKPQDAPAPEAVPTVHSADDFPY